MLWVGVCLASGCTPSETGNIRLWAVGPSERLTPRHRVRLETGCFSQSRNEIELAGALNEVVQFQLALQGSDRAGDVTIQFSPLTGSTINLSAGGFRAYRTDEVTVAPLPGWYLRLYGPGAQLRAPDILTPIQLGAAGDGVALRTDAVTPLWIEYRIPPDVPPGQYRGTLNVNWNGVSVRQVAVSLTVWPFALPDVRHTSMLAGVDIREVLGDRLGSAEIAEPALLGLLGEARRVEAVSTVYDACRLLHDHRLDPYLTGVYPAMRFKSNGDLALKWTRYDDVIRPLISGDAYPLRLPPQWWPLPVDRSRPPADVMGGADSAAYARLLRQYLRLCRRHFAENGWGERAFIDLTDAPLVQPKPADFEAAMRFGRLAAVAAPDVPFVVSLFPSSMEPFGWHNAAHTDLSEVAGVWAPNAQFFDVLRLAPARQLGAVTWLRPDRPPFAGGLQIEADPIDVRSTAWHAYLQDSHVWLPQAAQQPRIDEASQTPPDVSRHWLIYPPARPNGEPRPSVRLKQLLRAMQDFEYLWLLEQNGRGGVARLVAESLVKATGSQAYVDHYADPHAASVTHDASLWELARRLMAEELEDAVKGRPPPKNPRFAERLDWARFLSASRAVVVRADGARWRESKTRIDARPTLECRLVVENGRRRPITGVLSF
ncbi:MAG: hypothetical protein V3T70_09405, partial [Phycisphaerae bacterium]